MTDHVDGDSDADGAGTLGLGESTRERARAYRRTVLSGTGAALTGSAFLGRAAASPAGEPRGVHASVTNDPTSTITLTWFTGGAVDPGTVVEYGDTPDLGETTEGEAESLPFVEGYVHRTTIAGLAAGQTVHYRVGGDSGFSDVFEVRTDDGDDRFRFTFLGDQGVKSASRANRDRALERDPDLHFVVGDLSYADGEPEVWDRYFDEQEPLLATTPTMTCPGNHEYGNYEGHEGAPDYDARTTVPDDDTAGHWYSFQYGTVHFSSLDSQGDVITEGKVVDELVWFERDLAEAFLARARGDIDWIVVFMHQPIYSNQDSRRSNPIYQALVEPVLHRYDVDLLLVGHNHMYERSYPMVFGQPTSEATRNVPYLRERVGFVQVKNGAGGDALYDFRPEHQFGSWQAAWAHEFCTTVVDVEDDRMEFRTVEAHTGDVLDEFVMLAQEHYGDVPADLAADRTVDDLAQTEEMRTAAQAAVALVDGTTALEDLTREDLEGLDGLGAYSVDLGW